MPYRVCALLVSSLRRSPLSRPRMSPLACGALSPVSMASLTMQVPRSSSMSHGSVRSLSARTTCATRGTWSGIGVGGVDW